MYSEQDYGDSDSLTKALFDVEPEAYFRGVSIVRGVGASCYLARLLESVMQAMFQGIIQKTVLFPFGLLSAHDILSYMKPHLQTRGLPLAAFQVYKRKRGGPSEILKFTASQLYGVERGLLFIDGLVKLTNLGWNDRTDARYSRSHFWFNALARRFNISVILSGGAQLYPAVPETGIKVSQDGCQVSSFMIARKLTDFIDKQGPVIKEIILRAPFPRPLRPSPP